MKNPGKITIPPLRKIMFRPLKNRILANNGAYRPTQTYRKAAKVLLFSKYAGILLLPGYFVYHEETA
jgi:hypothetical protein